MYDIHLAQSFSNSLLLHFSFSLKELNFLFDLCMEQFSKHFSLRLTERYFLLDLFMEQCSNNFSLTLTERNFLFDKCMEQCTLSFFGFPRFLREFLLWFYFFTTSHISDTPVLHMYFFFSMIFLDFSDLGPCNCPRGRCHWRDDCQ